jgi:hypothetical protein
MAKIEKTAEQRAAGRKSIIDWCKVNVPFLALMGFASLMAGVEHDKTQSGGVPVAATPAVAKVSKVDTAKFVSAKQSLDELCDEYGIDAVELCVKEVVCAIKLNEHEIAKNEHQTAKEIAKHVDTNDSNKISAPRVSKHTGLNVEGLVK